MSKLKSPQQIPILSDRSANIVYNVADLPFFLKEEHLTDFPEMESLPHWNTEMEVVFAKNGNMNMCINGNNICLHEGEACIIDAGCIHYFSSIDQNDCTYVCALINESIFTTTQSIRSNYIDPVFHAFHPNYVLITPEDSYYDLILQQFEQIGYLATNQPPAYDLLLVSKLHELMAIFCNMVKKDFYLQHPIQNPESAITRDMVIYIQNHVSQKITVEDIAAAGGISRKTCFSLFKKYLNETPANFLMTYRLHTARNLLQNTNIPLIEISATCGFTHQSHFTNNFSKHYGITPNQLRKKFQS